MMNNGFNAQLNGFSDALFWDVAIESIDVELHARFIIERVVGRGNLHDWKLLKKVYGKKKIKNEVTKIRNLDAKTLSFLSAYFSVEKTSFRCCN
nr:hypothetical protein [Desulfobulbaceae bacterium]